MNEQEVINWISQLTEKQFIEFFYRSVASRKEFDKGIYQSHLVLTEAFRFLDREDDWSLRLLCVHDPQEYPNGWADDVPICQEGECCGHATGSYAKHAICPVCGNEAYGT